MCAFYGGGIMDKFEKAMQQMALMTEEGRMRIIGNKKKRARARMNLLV